MSLDCPRCKHASLEEIEFGEVPIDRCPCCAGLWFDNAEVSRLTGLKTNLQGFESIVPPSSIDGEEMNCPRCKDVSLRRLSIATKQNRNAVLYRCASCLGTWLDRGELREIEDPKLVESLTAYFSRINDPEI